MLPWLMRLGPLAARAGRGVNLARRRLFAKDPFIKRPAVAGGDAPYTPLRPYHTGGGTRGRPAPTRLGRDPALAPGEVRHAKYPDIPAQMYPKGYARRHPYKFGAKAAGIGATGALVGYPFLRGGDEEPPIDPTLMTAPTDPWSAPEDMMSFAESEIARVEEGEQNFRKLMDYGMLIAATGGNAEKFFERGKWVLEQSDQYAQDKQYAKAVRAVYKEGDMPKSAREAYNRLTPLMGPEKAAVLSGHQLGMETGKTKEERAWNEIMAVAQMGDLDGAAAQLVAAWNSGRLKNPATHITIYSAQIKKARETLAGVMSGGAGYAQGVTDIALREASA